MIYLSADTHYQHDKNFIYERRGFSNIKEHDNELIRKYNETVKPEDTCYFLGDFCLAGKERYSIYQKLLNKLNGNKILILGNHDELNPFTYVNAGFTSVHTSLILNDNILLIHDPSALGVFKEFKGLHGHVHSLYLTAGGNAVNVGVDVWDNKPVELNIALEILNGNRKED